MRRRAMAAILIILLTACTHYDETNENLSEEFVEYGKYSDLRNSELEEYEYNIKLQGTNIIKRSDYYEFNSEDPQTGQKVFVYTTKNTKSLMDATDLTVECNQKTNKIEGYCYTKTEHNRIEFVDLNQDDKNEICVYIDEGSGMGMSLLQLHVFDSETLKEYEIEDPVSYVERIAAFEETEDGGIHLKVGGRDYYASEQGIEEIYQGGGINNLGQLSNYRHVYVDGNYVYATVLWNYGVFKLHYIFQNNEFKISNFEVGF